MCEDRHLPARREFDPSRLAICRPQPSVLALKRRAEYLTCDAARQELPREGSQRLVGPRNLRITTKPNKPLMPFVKPDRAGPNAHTLISLADTYESYQNDPGIFRAGCLRASRLVVSAHLSRVLTGTFDIRVCSGRRCRSRSCCNRQHLC